MTSRLVPFLLAGAALFAAGPAQADAVDTLREVTRDEKSARAAFTQVVTAPDEPCTWLVGM